MSCCLLNIQPIDNCPNGSTERGKMKKTGSGANNSPIFFGGEGFDPIFSRYRSKYPAAASE